MAIMQFDNQKIAKMPRLPEMAAASMSCSKREAAPDRRHNSLRMPSIANAIFFTLCTVYLTSCVSISPATVELSAKVGERLTEMEQLHQLAIQRYFDVEEQKVKNFMTKTWEPLFLKNFLGTSEVLAKLDSVSRISMNTQSAIQQTVERYLEDKSEAEKVTGELIDGLDKNRTDEVAMVRTVLEKYVEDHKLNMAVIHVNSLLGTDEAARIILEFAEAAHREMQDQREELLAPIQMARKEVMAELSAAYGELIKGQSIITGRLEAARRKSEQQDLLLGKLGVDELYKDITNRMVRGSAQVDQALRSVDYLIGEKEKGNLDEALQKAMNTLIGELQELPNVVRPGSVK